MDILVCASVSSSVDIGLRSRISSEVMLCQRSAQTLGEGTSYLPKVEGTQVSDVA